MSQSKEWSQRIFLFREDGAVEVIVEGHIEDGKLVITSTTECECGEKVVLTDGEMADAKECLYDSMFNYTGPGEKFSKGTP